MFGTRRWLGVLLAVAAGSSTEVQAQRPVELGAYVGRTSSKPLAFDCGHLLVTGNDACSVTTSEPHFSESGITLGAYVRVPVVSVALVEADLLYVQKGENGGPNGTHTTHHYLELPLLAEVDPLRSRSYARAFVLAGLSPAIRVACTVKGPIFDNDTFMAVNYDGSCEDLPPPLDKQVPKRFDLGLVVGAGVGWDLTFGTIEVQVRYTRGLVDTMNDDGGKTINRAIVLMAGFGVAVRGR